MGQLGTQHCVSRWRLLPGTREPGLCGELPGLHPPLQPEEEERRAAARVRLSAGVGRPRPGPAAAGKTPGEGGHSDCSLSVFGVGSCGQILTELTFLGLMHAGSPGRAGPPRRAAEKEGGTLPARRTLSS